MLAKLKPYYDQFTHSFLGKLAMGIFLGLKAVRFLGTLGCQFQYNGKGITEHVYEKLGLMSIIVPKHEPDRQPDTGDVVTGLLPYAVAITMGYKNHQNAGVDLRMLATQTVLPAMATTEIGASLVKVCRDIYRDGKNAPMDPIRRLVFPYYHI